MIFEYIYEKFRVSFFTFLLVFIFVYSVNSPMVYSSTIDINFDDVCVIEELRLKVPFQFKEVWLQSEKEIWEPWLSTQNGFLGRNIYWNKKKEEALILINWKNKKLWKNISMKEVNKVQEEFDENVKSNLNISENPFKLIYEGELEKQQ